MAIWAIADLHLSFGTPNKKMDIFGPAWVDHAEKIQKHWLELIRPEDLVLIPGDISWAMRIDQVMADLEWIHRLPGTKVMIRGNHDYWWSSPSKVRAALPPSLFIVQNDTFLWKDVEIAGARLWDTPEYGFEPYIERREPATETEKKPFDLREEEKIFERELSRIELSLKNLKPTSKFKIAMTHYPPIGADLKPSRTSQMLSQYGVQCCLFGHLHNVRRGTLPFGVQDNVQYLLTSCDYLDFTPLKVSDE